MTTRRMLIFAALALMAAMPISLGAKSSDEVRLRATLAGPRMNSMTPSGHADFRSGQGRSRLNIEVEDVKIEPGTLLDAFVDGNKVGTITVEAVTLGGEIEFNSTDGDTVPSVHKGSVVVVKLGTQAILAGVF